MLFPAARGLPARVVFSRSGEQPGLGRGGRPLLLSMIISGTAGPEDDGAQLGGAAATRVVEVHERKAGSGHRILQERDRRRLRQAMLAAEMQNSADKAMAAVSVIITAARPVAVVGKISSIRSSSCTAWAISAWGIGLMAPDPDNEISLSRAAAAIRIAACSRQDDRLDQTPIVVLDVAAASIVAAAVFNDLGEGRSVTTRAARPERRPRIG